MTQTLFLLTAILAGIALAGVSIYVIPAVVERRTNARKVAARTATIRVIR